MPSQVLQTTSSFPGGIKRLPWLLPKEPDTSSRGTELFLPGAKSPSLWPQAAGRRNPWGKGLSAQEHRAPGRSRTSSQRVEQPEGKIFHLGDETFPCSALPGRLQLDPLGSSAMVARGQEAGATLLMASASSEGSSSSQLRAWNYLTRRNHNVQHRGAEILQQALPPPKRGLSLLREAAKGC